MFYFYLVVGRPKPYIIDVSSEDVGSKDVYSRYPATDLRRPLVRMDFGFTESRHSPGSQLEYGQPERIARQHTIARKQLPNRLVSAEGQQAPQRTLRRLRSRSAQQLRSTNLIPAPSALIATPISQPAFPHHQTTSNQRSQPLGPLFFDESTLSWRPLLVAAEEDTAFQTSPPRPSISRQRTVPAGSAVRRQSGIDLKPLPPLPSRFRLGEDELPWQTAHDIPAWLPPDSDVDLTPRSIHTEPVSAGSSHARSPSLSHIVSPMSTYAQPISRSINSSSPGQYYSSSTPQHGLTYPPSTYSHMIGAEDIASPPSFSAFSTASRNGNEDPNRARDMAILQSAMLTIDSPVVYQDRERFDEYSQGLGDDWDTQAEVAHLPRGVSVGPSLGWAVRVEPEAAFALRNDERRESQPIEYASTAFHVGDWIREDFAASYYGESIDEREDMWPSSTRLYHESDWYWDGNGWRRGSVGSGLGRRRSMLG